jgi:hypothetical protein
MTVGVDPCQVMDYLVLGSSQNEWRLSSRVGIRTLIVDRLRHVKLELVELIGASITGMVLASGFRTKQPKS